jgi:hypothetical protein
VNANMKSSYGPFASSTSSAPSELLAPPARFSSIPSSSPSAAALLNSGHNGTNSNPNSSPSSPSLFPVASGSSHGHGTSSLHHLQLPSSALAPLQAESPHLSPRSLRSLLNMGTVSLDRNTPSPLPTYVRDGEAPGLPKRRSTSSVHSNYDDTPSSTTPALTSPATVVSSGIGPTMSDDHDGNHSTSSSVESSPVLTSLSPLTATSSNDATAASSTGKTSNDTIVTSNSNNDINDSDTHAPNGDHHDNNGHDVSTTDDVNNESHNNNSSGDTDNGKRIRRSSTDSGISTGEVKDESGHDNSSHADNDNNNDDHKRIHDEQTDHIHHQNDTVVSSSMSSPSTTTDTSSSVVASPSSSGGSSLLGHHSTIIAAPLPEASKVVTLRGSHHWLPIKAFVVALCFSLIRGYLHHINLYFIIGMTRMRLIRNEPIPFMWMVEM